MKYKFAFALMLASATVSSEQYKSITSGGFEHRESESRYRNKNDESDIFSVNSAYYASPKANLGPLKEFDYINNVSNFFGEFSSTELTEARRGDQEREDSLLIGGEYFHKSFKLGGSIKSADESGFYSASAGYFFNPGLLVELEATSFKDDDEDDEVLLRGQYRRPLSNGNYLGFTASVDQELENRTLSSKFFTNLVGDRYLTLELSMLDNDETGQFWRGDVEFYFNKGSSVSLQFEKNNNYKVEATHFFNRSLAATMAYGSNLDSDDDSYRGSNRNSDARDLFSIGLLLQL